MSLVKLLIIIHIFNGYGLRSVNLRGIQKNATLLIFIYFRIKIGRPYQICSGTFAHG